MRHERKKDKRNRKERTCRSDKETDKQIMEEKWRREMLTKRVNFKGRK